MLRLFLPLLSNFAAGNIKLTIRRTRNHIFCWLIVAFALLMALIFLCLITFLWLISITTPIIAASIIFSFWISLAIIALIIGQLITARKQREYEKQKKSEQQNILAATAIAALPLLTNKKALVAIGLPLAGLAISLLMKKEGDEAE